MRLDVVSDDRKKKDYTGRECAYVKCGKGMKRGKG